MPAAWTFLLPLMAFVAAKRGYKALHQAIWLGVLLILVAIGASGLSTGEWLIFNPPLYGVGVPMIGLLGTALYVERTTEEKEGRVLVTALPLIATRAVRAAGLAGGDASRRTLHPSTAPAASCATAWYRLPGPRSRSGSSASKSARRARTARSSMPPMASPR